MGRVGDIERSQNILIKVKDAIEQEEIPLDRILNKSVVVVDEYQDVSKEEYEFLMAIVNKSERIRVIVVGDDDQNIYEFRGSSIQYMRDFIKDRAAATYYLTKNYRSKSNLLEFTNRFLKENFTAERIKHDKPLIAHDQRNGVIEIIQYDSPNLILPLIDHLKKHPIKGTTAVLTKTNEEAMLITSLLRKEDYPAVLISEQQGFSLKDLLEIQSFTFYIKHSLKDDFGLVQEESWAAAKHNIKQVYVQSKNLDLVERVINAFEQVNPKKLFSRWKDYLKQIRVEDFYFPEKNKILVSTMHKSKGKEFDTVFVLLSNFQLTSEEKKRVLYVAMTRARNNLYIHTNSVSFSGNNISAINISHDKQEYPSPNTLILELAMKDIWLGFFKRRAVAYAIKQMKSGDQLVQSQADSSILETGGGDPVLKFSRAFEYRLNGFLDKGYYVKSLSVKYIVVWYDEETNRSYRVVLPEIMLGKG
jgi:ATP-dependent DNA helicase RecQ